jgi:uncharacterized membrane protein (DUF485 family)
MKTRIIRFSPHQNAKTFSVLMAITSLIFVVPFVLIFSLFPPVHVPGTPSFPPVILFILFPVIYLIFGYISTLIFCALYNLIARLTGGIEFVNAEASIK